MIEIKLKEKEGRYKTLCRTKVSERHTIHAMVAMIRFPFGNRMGMEGIDLQAMNKSKELHMWSVAPESKIQRCCLDFRFRAKTIPEV